jgi:predicted small lipoprotein YifL
MNNKLKKVFLGLILLSSLFILTGCGKKEPIDVEQFTKKAKDKGYDVVDVSKQYEKYEYIKSGTVASSNNKWQVELYILEDETGAKNMYNINKNKFNKEKHNSKTYSEVTMKNYSKYTLKANNKYMYLSRVDNTLIYCDVESKYEEEAKKFIKELNY